MWTPNQIGRHPWLKSGLASTRFNKCSVATRLTPVSAWSQVSGSAAGAVMGLVRAQVPSDVAYDFFMLQYRPEPESRPAPVNEFEAAMEALCRIFGTEAEADTGPALPAATIADEYGRGRRESAQVRTAA
jgi:hypothetical protein